MGSAETMVGALVKTLGLFVGFCLFLTRQGYVLQEEQETNDFPENAWGKNRIVENTKDSAIRIPPLRNKNALFTRPYKESPDSGRRRQPLGGNKPRSDNFKGSRSHLRNRPSVRGGVASPYDPIEPAENFSLRCLSGTLQYPSSQLPQGTPILVHLHDNRSAYVEAMWSDADSLRSLVANSPQDTHYVFLSTAENATADALWMKGQLDGAMADHQPLLSPNIASRLHYVTTPVWQVGSWMPYLFKRWACSGHGCGYNQVVFEGSDEVMVEKRLDARYDWLPLPVMGNETAEAVVSGANGCQENEQVKGKIALVSSEGDCSYFTKVLNMQTSGAIAVLVYSQPGQPLKEMNCQEKECDTLLTIPGSMIPYNQALLQQLENGVATKVAYQNTPSDNFYFAIDEKGLLAEVGWFLYPSLQFLVWQAEWFEYKKALDIKLSDPDTVVFPMFNTTKMQGDPGIVVTVALPSDLKTYSTIELDMTLSCPGIRDEDCPDWDHIVNLYVSCDQTSPLANMELGRWITPFRRRIGRWITTVSSLLPLISSDQCNFTMNLDAYWAKEWDPSLNLRMSGPIKDQDEGEASWRPYHIIPVYTGKHTFDKSYNLGFPPKIFNVSSIDKKVELVSVITGHGSDENNCCEFCVTSHHFVINNITSKTYNMTFDTAGTPLGCADKVLQGIEPNEHGTWLYGRGGWCNGHQVDPWVIDVTKEVMVGNNNVTYYGWYNGTDPDPKEKPGYIIMYSYLVFYESL